MQWRMHLFTGLNQFLKQEEKISEKFSHFRYYCVQATHTERFSKGKGKENSQQRWCTSLNQKLLIWVLLFFVFFNCSSSLVSCYAKMLLTQENCCHGNRSPATLSLQWNAVGFVAPPSLLPLSVFILHYGGAIMDFPTRVSLLWCLPSKLAMLSEVHPNLWEKKHWGGRIWLAEPLRRLMWKIGVDPLGVLEECRTMFLLKILFNVAVFPKWYPRIWHVTFWHKVTDWNLWQRWKLCLPVGPSTVQCEGAPPFFLPCRMQHWVTQEREEVWSTQKHCSVFGLPFYSQVKSCLRPQPAQTRTSWF